jgi:hypothetical protein
VSGDDELHVREVRRQPAADPPLPLAATSENRRSIAKTFLTTPTKSGPFELTADTVSLVTTPPVPAPRTRGTIMTATITDRWHIPLATEAAARPSVAPGATAGRGAAPDRLASIAALDADRMAESLAFLSGYAPGVLDAILTATEPCLDDLLTPDQDDLEPYCTRCGATAGVFTALGNDWRHYAVTLDTGTARPFNADHAPVIGWRPATDPPIAPTR